MDTEVKQGTEGGDTAKQISFAGDAFLASLNAMVDSRKITGSTGLGLTLHVGGLIVCGDLISGDYYFEKFAESFVNACPESAKDQFNRMFQTCRDVHNAAKDPFLAYIHLENAYVIGTDAQKIPNNGTLWRGRLSQVDGFSLGVIRGNSR